MIKKRSFILLSVWVVIIGCFNVACSGEKHTSQLSWGKYYLWNAPDSAYQILRTIPSPEKLSKEEYSLYALLMTQVMHRCGQEISSDSLIDIAVKYYSSHGTSDEKASAFLYKGYVLESLGKDNEAIYANKQAEEAVKSAKDLRIHFLVYVALGHIHRPQKMGRETLRYSGTPLKYSFSEADHKKSVTIVELLEKGNVRVSTVPLIPRRDMRKLRGTYMDVTAKDHYTAENKMDYLQITLTDEEDVPGALQKLRTVYPNLMRLEYDNKRTRENREVQAVEAQEQKSELELFEEFYELLNNEPMKEEQAQFVEKLIQNLKEVRV